MSFYTRPLTEADWQILKQIRLEALTLHPNFFAPSRDEFKFTAEDWKERLRNKDGVNFGLFNDKDEIIGLTGIFRDHEDRANAWMVASYIKAAHRRMGLTKFLYESRIQWAKAQNDIHTLVVHHHIDNVASKKSHQNFNFEFIKTYPAVKWPNGESAPYEEYRLKIR